MKSAKCLHCGAITTNGLDYCNIYLENLWNDSSGFIKPKHDPTKLPLPLPTFRSVVTMDFITNEGLFIHTIIENADYFYDNIHNNFCCVLNQSLGVVSGSAIPPYYDYPTYPLDSLIVVDVINNPHVFADDYKNIISSVNNGKLNPVV